MALSYTKPNAALLRELQAVASAAQELECVLKTANALPEDFAISEITALTKTLMGLPKGTAEGCREILDYCRVRLADIGQQNIKPEDDQNSSEYENDTRPALARGMAVDRAIGQLLLSISYAQAEYSRQSGEEIADDSGAEPGVEPSEEIANEFSDLRRVVQSVEVELETFGRHVNDTTLPKSVRADELSRQTQDANGHAGLARNELTQPKPKPGRLERINRVLSQLPDVIEKTGKSMKVGLDIAVPFADQWFNQLPTDILNLVVKHLRIVSDNLEKAGQRLRKGGDSTSSSIQLPLFYVFRDIDAPWCPEMVKVPAGTFLMGSPDTEWGRNEDEAQHKVTISQPFVLGRYPVTFVEYEHFCQQTDRKKAYRGGHDRRPVISVSHGDAEAYCAWLSEATGRCYHLPSEAQWEYACRAGTTTAYAFGDELTPKQANFGFRQSQTSPVDTYPANAWGLHDMHGNVWEWCADWKGDYPLGDVTNPQGPATGLYRTARGGCFNHDGRHARAAYRAGYEPGAADVNIGFRCAGIQES